MLNIYFTDGHIVPMYSSFVMRCIEPARPGVAWCIPSAYSCVVCCVFEKSRYFSPGGLRFTATLLIVIISQHGRKDKRVLERSRRMDIFYLGARSIAAARWITFGWSLPRSREHGANTSPWIIVSGSRIHRWRFRLRSRVARRVSLYSIRGSSVISFGRRERRRCFRQLSDWRTRAFFSLTRQPFPFIR